MARFQPARFRHAEGQAIQFSTSGPDPHEDAPTPEKSGFAAVQELLSRVRVCISSIYRCIS